MELHNRKHPLLHRFLCTFLPERCPYCDKVIASDQIHCDKCKSTFIEEVYKSYAKGGFPCISATPYTDNFSDAIKRFKFSDRRQYAFSLAMTMAESIIKEYSDIEFDYIAYVPMHHLKLRERGYNQSQLLAKKLSQILDIPLADVLVKTRNNQPQHTIDNAALRAENVKGVFKAINRECIKDKNILLIDDIITTGNTLGECAKMLMKLKPRNILCATFSHAVAKTS